MHSIRFFVFVVLFSFVFSGDVSAQIGKRTPAKIGFVYPAGGQRGTTFEVWVAGRLTSRTTAAVFSGEGISAKVVDTGRLFVNQDQRDRFIIRNRIGDAASRLVSEAPEGVLMKELIEKLPKVNKPPDPPEEIEAVPFVWPRLTRLRKLAEPDAYVPMEEMLDIVYHTYGPGMWLRPPDVLHEVVVLEVSISPDAEPGDRELRLQTNTGISNPMYFQIGIHPEIEEREPNDRDTHHISQVLAKFPRPVLDVPVVINGQITHADIDRFQFRAKKGQPLVLNVQARQLMPFLADGVPGWFEAMVTVLDENERELAYSDCFRFHADPVLVFDPPVDGVYTAEVRDSLFRGREDFVYRLTIATTPLVEHVFPLGLREGTEQTLHLDGKNLAVKEIVVKGTSDSNPIREISRLGSQWLPRPILYEVDTLPEVVEAENNNARETAQAVPVPVNVNGRIMKPGEYDFYRFEGRENEPLVLEIKARRLNSPLDSRIAVLDAEGKILAENDDGPTIDENNNYISYLIGTQTHNADSKLTFTPPATGPYFVRIGDATRAGSPAHAYRLRISGPRPDFDVFTTPSSPTLFAGTSDMIWFYVNRKEDYQGPVEIKLVGDARGFQLDGGLIQAGQDKVVCTLTTPPDPLNKGIPLRFEAVAVWGDQTVRRPVYPVEDMEQAFLYHHWVPAENLWVLMNSRRGLTELRSVKQEFLKLKPGETVDVEFETEKGVTPTTVFYLREASPGLWVRKKSQERIENKTKLVLTFGANADVLQKAAEKEYASLHPTSAPMMSPEGQEQADKPTIEPKQSLSGNFLVVIEGETVPKTPEEKKTRYPLGMLPAIPFHIEP